MTRSNDEIRAYLADQYNVETIDILNGAEADEDQAGLYYGEDFSWLVHGTMPNTNEVGWFYAGSDSDISREMHNYENRPK